MSDSKRVRLELIGPVRAVRTDSSSTGRDGASPPPLTGPRRLAVLVYLALARPRGMQSRDTVAALLWPESDQGAARHNLRNTLHAIRQSLGDDVIRSAGDDVIGLNLDAIGCDILELEYALTSGHVATAIAAFHGEVLQGFYVSGASDFERWLDGERRRLIDLVLPASRILVEELRDKGDIAGAVAAARKMCELAPDDELSLRTLLRVLDDAGDRAGAMRAYEDFATRLQQEYAAEPSRETQLLVRSMRSDAAPNERGAAVVDARLSVLPSTPALAPLTHRQTGRRWWVAAAAIVVIALTGTLRMRGEAPPRGPVLAVMAMENRTGDHSLDYLTTGLPENAARRILGVGGLTVRSSGRAELTKGQLNDLDRLYRSFGAAQLLNATLDKVGDSLEIHPILTDLATHVSHTLRPHRFVIRDIQTVESLLAADIVGVLFRSAIADRPRMATRAVDPESYRLEMLGWQRLLSDRDHHAALQLFQDATRADRFNARAWSGLSSAWAALLYSESAPLHEAAEQVDAAAKHAIALDTMQGTAYANLAFVRAIRDQDLEGADSLIRKAEIVDPSNAEVFLIASSIYRHTWQWDQARDAMRIASKLDPVNPAYTDREATIEICADRFDAAQHVYDQQLRLDRNNRMAQAGMVRLLALTHRYGEALRAWDQSLDTIKAARLHAMITRASPDSIGYWNTRHADVVAHPPKDADVSPTRHLQMVFGSGDLDRGYALLDSLSQRGDFTLHRLRCNVGFDEVRRSPRFLALVSRVGALRRR